MENSIHTIFWLFERMLCESRIYLIKSTPSEPSDWSKPRAPALWPAVAPIPRTTRSLVGCVSSGSVGEPSALG